MTFEYILILIILFTILAYGTSYYMKKKHYRNIDELEQEKIELMNLPVVNDVLKASHLQMTGQTEKNFKEWKGKWRQVETVSFPEIENHLFEAERSTDRLLLTRAGKSEQLAEDLLNETKKVMQEMQKAITKLMQNEERNRAEVERIHEMYQGIRRKLLTQSFAFGPALENLEKELTQLETGFSTFADYTSQGDHIEAEAVLEKVQQETEEMNEAIQAIPKLLKELNSEFTDQLGELRSGYHQLKGENFVFLDDHLPQEMDGIESAIRQTERLISELDLDAAEANMAEIEEKIDSLYDTMETEIAAKAFVIKRHSVLLEYIEFVLEKNQKLLIEIDRVSQSYNLNQEEKEKANEMQNQLEEIQEEFESYTDGLNEQQVVFSVVKESFEAYAQILTQIEETQKEMNAHLLDLRKEELEVKEKIDEFEYSMRGMKRYVEKQHLPGLPVEYLDLFFLATDRIEKLSKEVNKLKIDVEEVKKLCKLCEDDVQLLAKKTDELVDSALLTEYMMQYANRYRNTHPQVAHAVKQTYALFHQDFLYQEALETISMALEDVEPGSYKKVESLYFEEKETSQ